MKPSRDAHVVFEAARSMLTGLAYRILGSYAEAEDAVQDTFVSWMSADQASIEQPRSWLIAVCTRKAVDTLKSARRARTNYVGAWLPEPIYTDSVDTPETRLELSESVTMAFLLVLERLAPKERAAFLLHDVFALDYRQIADSLEISEAACRKLVSRARANLQRNKTTHAAPPERQDELVAAFETAIATGATDPLARLLSSDAVLSADGGGKVVAIQHDLHGPAEILAFIAGTLAPHWRAKQILRMEVNARQALVLREEDHTHAVVSFAYDADGKAASVLITRNPDKLAQIDRLLSGPGAH